MKVVRRVGSAALLALTLIPLLCPAQGISARLRGAVERYVKEGQFSGAVLVARGDDILLADGWGFANRAWQQRNDANTRFRLGSLTKSFTAVLVMRLVQDGRLHLSDSIGHYIEGLSQHAAETITIKHLLTHSSGLPEFYRVPDFNRLWLYEPEPVEDLIRRVASHPLEFTPGTQYAYRNTGYLVLGYIIERVTNLAYETALQQYVLQPAGMTDSGVERQGEIVPQQADSYAQTEDGWRRGAYLNPDLLYAAGGMYASARDLFRFSSALDTHLLLNEATQRLLFTPQVKERDDTGDHRYYAFGWHVERVRINDLNSEVLIMEHGGDVTSFETLLTRIPALQAVVIILHNHGEVDQDIIRDALIRILLSDDRRDGRG